MNQEKPDHIQEKLYSARAGGPIVLGLSLALLLDLVLFVFSLGAEVWLTLLVSILLVPVILFLLWGSFVVNPNEGRVSAVLRTLRRHSQRSGTPLGQSAVQKRADLASGPQLRDGTLQGQRHRRQSYRDGRCRRLERG